MNKLNTVIPNESYPARGHQTAKLWKQVPESGINRTYEKQLETAISNESHPTKVIRQQNCEKTVPELGEPSTATQGNDTPCDNRFTRKSS